jgi:NAD(P)-dependent dehydrogenase (short-subunit alcohol dehydrogenase family)
MATSVPTNQAVLVTGASTGIGKAIVERLVADGVPVFAAVRDLSTVEPNPLVTPVRLEVTSAEEAATAAKTVQAALGGNLLRGIVNNAGIGVGGPLEFLDLDELRRQFEVNLFGQVAVTQAFLPILREQGPADPRIVFTSSIAGRVSPPFMGPYGASKHALNAIAESMRIELHPWGFEVSVLAPGNVATPIWDKSRAEVKSISESLPESAVERYGDRINEFGNIMNTAEARGIAPSVVAAAAHHALYARRPKHEYLIGPDAKQMAVASSLLPSRLFDRLVMREMGRLGKG